MQMIGSCGFNLFYPRPVGESQRQRDAMAQVSTMSRISAVFAGSAGNLVEWFDWYTYSAAALYFAPIFFPKGDRTEQLLQTAAVFAVGFFARPLGAWLMGLYAD